MICGIFNPLMCGVTGIHPMTGATIRAIRNHVATSSTVADPHVSGRGGDPLDVEGRGVSHDGLYARRISQKGSES
jgi:hypothetical protein